MWNVWSECEKMYEVKWQHLSCHCTDKKWKWPNEWVKLTSTKLINNCVIVSFLYFSLFSSLFSLFSCLFRSTAIIPLNVVYASLHFRQAQDDKSRECCAHLNENVMLKMAIKNLLENTVIASKRELYGLRTRLHCNSTKKRKEEKTRTEPFQSMKLYKSKGKEWKRKRIN